jgi:hypothetical protein
MAGSTVIATVPVYHKLDIRCVAVCIRSCIDHREILDVVSFGLQTHITSNRHVVHCTLMKLKTHAFFLIVFDARTVTVDFQVW